MDQIICDLCGTAYHRTDDRCPVCSYPRQGNEAPASTADSGGHKKVKGGRFSTKNVKKRQKAQRKAAKQAGRDPNRVLKIIIALLLAAILLVSGYIAMRFFRARDAFQPRSAGVQTTLSLEAPVSNTI